MEQEQDVGLNKIVNGKIVRITDDNVIVDVGFKSEGVIPLNEWEEEEEPATAGSRSSRCSWKISRTARVDARSVRHDCAQQAQGRERSSPGKR